MDEVIHIPGYRIEKLLGKGAMATVYMAIQESLERQVALKIMAPSLSIDTTFCKRFLKEGKIVGQLNHPNIITIFDTGVFQSRYYMAMECITGGTLKERIQENRLSLDEKLNILCQIASALGYAHKRLFVHRDVKPANILFRDYGAAVLSDFGIAKSFSDSTTQITAVGWTVGTPNYMSPEQALGKTVDARSDLYSLGVVFYEMLTGERPYQSEDSFAIALMHVQNPVPRLPEKFACYQSIIDRLLAKNPNDRFATAEELIKSIDQIHHKAGMTLPAPKNLGARVSIIVGKIKQIRFFRRFRHATWILVAGLSISVIGVAVYPYIHEVYLYLQNETPNGQQKTISNSTSGSLSDNQTQAQIQTLLKVADSHREIGYLTDPPGSNAMEVYQRVLALDPSNAEAKEGLKAIADTYEARARESMEKQQPLKTTLNLIETGLKAMPNHKGLHMLEENIKKKISSSSS